MEIRAVSGLSERAWAAALLLAAGVGCYTEIRAVRVGPPREALPEDCSVRVFYPGTRPPREAQVVGSLVARGLTDASSLVQQMRERVCALGGNALASLTFRTESTGSGIAFDGAEATTATVFYEPEYVVEAAAMVLPQPDDAPALAPPVAAEATACARPDQVALLHEAALHDGEAITLVEQLTPDGVRSALDALRIEACRLGANAVAGTTIRVLSTGIDSVQLHTTIDPRQFEIWPNVQQTVHVVATAARIPRDRLAALQRASDERSCQARRCDAEVSTSPHGPPTTVELAPPDAETAPHRLEAVWSR